MKLSALLQKAAELRHYQLHMRERSLMVRRQQIRLEQEEEALRQRRQAGAAQIAPRRPDSERPTARASAPGYKTALATLFRQSSAMSWWQRQPRFSVWQLFCPSQFPAFRNGVRVQRWLVPTDTTFAAGDVLCELQFSPDRRRGNSRWQDYLLQAPQDGYLLGVEHSSDAVRSKDALGFFIPLPEWQAFVTLLDTHEAAIARLREEERRLAGFRQELAERSRAKQRAAVPGRAAAAVEPSRERQETALAELTARLRRSYARVTAGLPPHRTWLQAQPLAECLALLLSGAADGTESAWPALLASRERTELERALKRLLAAQVPFSAAELRRLQPVLQRLNAVQARFAAIDHEVREAMRDGNLSPAQEEAFLCRQEQEVTALSPRMSRQVYRQLCADPRRFDFGCLPLLLPAPRHDRSWTIRWHQPDRALVVSGERLLHLQSNSGEERREVSAPAPGRLCVLVPDSRFVAHFQPVGTLEYGVRFAPPPAPTGEAQELERQLDVLRQAEVRQARRQQAEERQQREGEGRLRELSRQVATAEAAAAASQQSHAAAIAAVPELRQALLNRILTLLSERPSARVPFPALWQGLLLLTQLSAAPPAGKAPPSAAAPTDGLIARFFQWLLPQVTASSPPLPAVLQRHRQECWEEIAEAFLPAPSSSAEHMIPESRR